MGTVTSRKDKRSKTLASRAATVVVDPSAALDATLAVLPSAPVAQEAQSTGKRKPRKPLMCGADGKPVHGLVATPDNYSADKHGRLVRQQFKSAAHWFAHCKYMAEQDVLRYAGLVQDATAHPENYKRSASGIGKAVLQSQVSKLEAALLARGFTAEQIAEIYGA